MEYFLSFHEGKQNNDTRNMKNLNFVARDVQRILSSHKISEKYNEQEMLYKKNCYQKSRNIQRKTPALESLF